MFLPSLSAQDKTEDGISIKEALLNLEQNRKVIASLKALEQIEEDQVSELLGLEEGLFAMLGDKSILKREKLAILNFIGMTGIPLKIVSAGAFVDMSLSSVEEVTSPILLGKMIEEAIRIGSTSGNLNAKVSKLVNKIILDATAKTKKYPSSLYIVCLKSLGASNSNKKVVGSLETLMKSISKLSPQLRIAVYKAIGNLAQADKKKSPLSKEQKLSFMKSLLQRMEKNPARLPLAASKNEIDELKANIYAVHYLINDPVVKSQKEKAAKFLIGILSHEDVELVELAGNALLDLSLGASGKKRFDLVSPIIKHLKDEQAKKKKKQSKLTFEKEEYLFRLLVKAHSVNLGSKQKEDQKRVEKALEFMYDTVLSHEDVMTIRMLVLDGFFSLEPALIESKTLNGASKKRIRMFFKDGVAIFGDKSFNKNYPEFINRISEVLYEMTGKNFGKDVRLWNEWYDKTGEKLFQ